MKEDQTTTEVCPRDDIAAYVDGELSADAAAKLELHIDSCRFCSSTLLEQRRFLAALSASLDRDEDIVLPADFTKRIVSNAESSVTGLRRPNEILTAVSICAALIIFALFAFGGETFALASAAGTIGEKLLAIGGFVVKIIANLAFAAAVIARSFANQTGAAGLSLPFVMFVVVVLIFSSRRITRRRNA